MDTVQFTTMMHMQYNNRVPDWRLQHPSKMTDDHDPEPYMQLFEVMATSGNWPQDQWANYLIPQLTEAAQAAAPALSSYEILHYPTLKAAILDCVAEIPEGYSKQFWERSFTTDVATAAAVPEAGDVATATAVPEAGEVGKATADLEAGELGTVMAVPEFADVATAKAVHEAGDVATANAALDAEEVETATALCEVGEVGTAMALRLERWGKQGLYLRLKSW
ncbi:hypothetical protein EOD39_20547 [Acipenser ruthenus]|uniref:Uncharacterized protein n=1 Tax=Acipenser ruthenus TaxID=7906 RepID=A0A444UV47_ACIRT|nr:hypothetical protein EOD39_20547 [Acipenser ruthenus]